MFSAMITGWEMFSADASYLMFTSAMNSVMHNFVNARFPYPVSWFEFFACKEIILGEHDALLFTSTNIAFRTYSGCDM